MKRITALILISVLCFCLFGCAKENQQITEGDGALLVSKQENAIELQKSIFICEVVSVSREDALINKYNSDITNYSVYTVNVTESLDGITPTGEATVYCMGTSDDFINRIGLVKGEKYILDAEPWIYGEKIVFLLAPMTTSFPKIDGANRVTLAISDNKAEDLGTLDSYKQLLADARKNVESRIDGFSDTKQIVARYKQMFENVKELTDKNWFRDFDYAWTPSDEFINKTRAYTAKVCKYVDTLAKREAVTNEDITNIFKQ